jgi:hypothetical protein
MAITQRNTLDPTAAASAWATRVGASGSKWLKGIETPRRLPNANPAANATAWMAGVTAAAPKFQQKITGQTYLDNLDKGATAKQGNYTSAGQRAQPNMQAAMSKVLPAIQTIVAALPPRGPRGTNGARSQQLQDALHALRGTL